jgi:hypothetical protein
MESTDTWLSWGVQGGDGQPWEKRSRHDLKAGLFGRPPIGIIEKSREYAAALLAQMDGNIQWPSSLRESWDALAQAVTT